MLYLPIILTLNFRLLESLIQFSFSLIKGFSCYLGLYIFFSNLLLLLWDYWHIRLGVYGQHTDQGLKMETTCGSLLLELQVISENVFLSFCNR